MSATNDPGPAVKKIEEFLRTLRTFSGLVFEFRILANGQVQPHSTESAGAAPLVSNPPSQSPEISVEFSGPDTPLLVARNAELLYAIENLTAKVLRLEPEEHDHISFDADNFKLLRNRELQLIAEAAIERVRATGRPYSFPPMNSRERRLLHLTLNASGLPTASSGLGPRRFVVVYPEGHQPVDSPQQPSTHASTHDRTNAIRNSFRRR